MERGYYLYGIIPGECSIEARAGIDAINNLFLLGDEMLKAVVSQVSLAEYNEETLAKKTEDILWLTEKATLHMDIVGKIHSNCPVIPIKFCTIFTGESGILDLIKKNRDNFSDKLRFLKGKDEYSIKLYVDEKNYNPPELEAEKLAFKKALKESSKGKAFMLNKNFESRLKERAEALVEEYRVKIWEALLRINGSGKLNKNLSSHVSGKRDRMILNSVFLVERTSEDDFREAVHCLVEQYQPAGLLLELSGPWPPYNFC